MAIDTKKVTIEGGEFQNTAINALGNITGSVSSKNIGETVNVGATKKDMKTIDFAKIFEKPFFKYLVLEIGADAPGDIKSICEYIKPDIAVRGALNLHNLKTEQPTAN